MESRLKTSSVEFQLLLACLRWPLTDLERDQICGLVRGALDMSVFIDLVLHHQVVPLVFRNLSDAARGKAPEAMLSNLRSKALTASKQTLGRVAETIHLSEKMQRDGIAVRVLKGAALSLQAYRDVTLQHSVDIDLLVPIEEVFDAEKVLLERGYTRTIPLARLTPRRVSWLLNHSHHLHFFHPQTHQHVELHWGLTPNPFKHERFQPPFRSMTHLQIGSKQIPSLSPQDMFLHACVHGAGHSWSLLKWLAQIAAMMRMMTHEELSAIATRAAKFGVAPEFIAAITLVDRYRLADISAAEDFLEPSRAKDRIVKRSREAIEGGPGYSNHAIADFRDAWLAASSFRYRRNLIERSIIREESWDLIDLPDSLFFGYVLVAPIAWLRHRNQARTRRAVTGLRPRNERAGLSSAGG